MGAYLNIFNIISMLGLITLILLCGLIYFIYKTIDYKHKADHNNYLRCENKLKKLENDYTNGKFDFLTYKYLRKEILIKYDLPIDYKEES